MKKEVKIIRKKQLVNGFRNLNIHVDNKFVCKIASGEEKIIEVDEQALTLSAKIDWCSSNIIKLNKTATNELILENFKYADFYVLSTIIA